MLAYELRRVITQAAFTIFPPERSPVPRLLVCKSGEIADMPGCRRAEEEPLCREVEKDDWPEPPGYLGEAVRRAKLIGQAMRAMQQAPVLD